jgi:nucleoid DNA-binding protein
MVQNVTLTKDVLARRLSEVLDLPYDRRQGESYRVVRAIVSTMANALLKGERIRIDGFGIFQTYERPATRTPVSRFLFKKGAFREIITLSPTKRIIFKPSKALLRFINEEPHARNVSHNSRS